MQTTLTDLAVLKPEIYGPLAQTKLAQFVDFFMAGLAERVSLPAGEFVPFPGFKQLSGTPDLIGDDYNPDINKIDPLKDIAVIRHHGKAFGSDDLAQIVTGQDPNGEIARQLARYFARYSISKSFISVLKGIFSTTGPLYTSNRYDIYADVAKGQATYQVLTPDVAATGLAKIGDEMDGIAGWIMHSKTKADLLSAGYLSTALNTTAYGMEGGTITMFMGKPIIVSDDVTTTAGTTVTKYRTYAVKAGALAYGVQKDLNPEQDRNVLKKMNFISTDLHFAAHVRGVKYLAAAGANPTDAVLETGTSWELSAELAKFVGVVAIEHN